MPIRLQSLEGGSSIVLDKPILLLGRHQECDIQIESRKISRRHCCIAQVDNTVLIRDLDSTNGIKVNGERVREARLGVGDEVVIGNSRYRVVSDSEVERPVPIPTTSHPVPVRRTPQPVHDPSDRTCDDDALFESSDVPISIDESALPGQLHEEDSLGTCAAENPEDFRKPPGKR